MVPPVRTSCLALLVVGSLFAGRSASPPEGKRGSLPEELQGVWSAASGEEDGRVMKFARDDEVGVGYTVFNEFIVQGDRLIVVEYTGAALAFRARLVAEKPEKQIEVWGDRSQTKQEGPYRWHYRVNGAELTVCGRNDGKLPTAFTGKKGSGQVLLLLKRE